MDQLLEDEPGLGDFLPNPTWRLFVDGMADSFQIDGNTPCSIDILYIGIGIPICFDVRSNELAETNYCFSAPHAVNSPIFDTKDLDPVYIDDGNHRLQNNKSFNLIVFV